VRENVELDLDVPGLSERLQAARHRTVGQEIRGQEKKLVEWQPGIPKVSVKLLNRADNDGIRTQPRHPLRKQGRLTGLKWPPVMRNKNDARLLRVDRVLVSLTARRFWTLWNQMVMRAGVARGSIKGRGPQNRSVH